MRLLEVAPRDRRGAVTTLTAEFDGLQPALASHPADRGPSGRRGDTERRQGLDQARHRSPATCSGDVVTVDVEERGSGLHGG